LCGICLLIGDDESARSREARTLNGAAQLAGVLGVWRSP